MCKVWQWLATFESSRCKDFKLDSLNHVLLVNRGTFRRFRIPQVRGHALYDLTSKSQHQGSGQAGRNTSWSCLALLSLNTNQRGAAAGPEILQRESHPRSFSNHREKLAVESMIKLCRERVE